MRELVALRDGDGAPERIACMLDLKRAYFERWDLSRVYTIARPQTLAQVIANASPELAADTYAAAALAITVDTDAERTWLDGLAQGLGLDPALRADIDARLAG